MKARRRGFTLIELLVVVAIIGLLISILLPSLSRAQEQARVAKCSANMRTIVQAANAYFSEQKAPDMVFAIPIGYIVGSETTARGISWYTEFIWGGGIPDKRNSDWDLSVPGNPITGNGADVYNYTPKERPMNEYVTPGVSWDSPDRKKSGSGSGANPTRYEKALDLPDVYKCPSDRTKHVPDASVPNPTIETEQPYRTWEYWGTSYAANWYWPYYYEDAPPGTQSPYNGDFLTILGGNSTNRIRSLGSFMLRGKAERGSAEFVLFYENMFNYAQAGARPRGFSNPAAKQHEGWHRQFSTFTAAFMDGHAEYRIYDTRYPDGPGWTTWPNRPWVGGWATYNEN